jgi:hypothetical protein
MIARASTLRAFVGLLAMGAGACQPPHPAQLVKEGRLLEACELAEEKYPEKSLATREEMRRQSDLRIELALLDAETVETLAGRSLPPELAVMRYRLDRSPGPVVSDIEVQELRALGKRHRPTHMTEALAVELVAGPDPRGNPDGLGGETLLLLFVFATVPLCIRGDCDYSKLKLPAHKELARRHQARWNQVQADPDLRSAKDRLLKLFGEERSVDEQPRSREGYLLLSSSAEPGARSRRRVTFLARHTLREDSRRCSLIDRFIVETDDLTALFASPVRLSELPVRELSVWPERGELPAGWE